MVAHPNSKEKVGACGIWAGYTSGGDVNRNLLIITLVSVVPPSKQMQSGRPMNALKSAALTYTYAAPHVTTKTVVLKAYTEQVLVSEGRRISYYLGIKMKIRVYYRSNV